MKDIYFCIGNYWKIHYHHCRFCSYTVKMDGSSNHIYSGYLGCRQPEETVVMKD